MKMILTTHCKCFDNSVIIINTLQIELQWSCYKFLLVTQEKSAAKKKNAKGCFSFYLNKMIGLTMRNVNVESISY